MKNLWFRDICLDIRVRHWILRDKTPPKASYLDAVPSAVTQAWNIPMKNLKGFSLTITKYINGRKMPPWIMRPTITVIMYIPSCLATTSKSAIEMIFPQMRQAIPSGEYLMVNTGYFNFKIVNWRIIISRIFLQSKTRGKVWQYHWLPIMQSTYHIIAPTSLITISFRTLKNSSISLAFSPIFPMITPKATKNPIRPVIQTKVDKDVFFKKKNLHPIQTDMLWKVIVLKYMGGKRRIWMKCHIHHWCWSLAHCLSVCRKGFSGSLTMISRNLVIQIQTDPPSLNIHWHRPGSRLLRDF